MQNIVSYLVYELLLGSRHGKHGRFAKRAKKLFELSTPNLVDIIYTLRQDVGMHLPWKVKVTGL